MTKRDTPKVKKSAHERFCLKIDKIITTLIQMKPIADTSDKKAFLYGNLQKYLEYAEQLAKES